MSNAENKLADIEHQVEEIYDYQIDSDYVEEKLIVLEDRPRRNNLRVDGIVENSGETWEDCEEKLNNCSRRNLAENALLKSKEHIEHPADKIIRTMVTTYKE